MAALAGRPITARDKVQDVVSGLDDVGECLCAQGVFLFARSFK
jgi:hypothetical protein